MKKIFIAAVAAMSMAPFGASADITINLPAGSGIDSIAYYYAPIENLAKAKSQAELGIVQAKAPVKDNRVVVGINDAPGGTRYGFTIAKGSFIDLYTVPGENIVAEVKSVSPFDYSLSGSALVDGMTEVSELTKPIMEKQKALSAAGQPSQEALMELYGEYNQALKDFIEENPASEKALIAVMQLSGEDFAEAFPRLSERAKSSILYPLAERKYADVQEQLEKERKQQEMANGSTPAPDFTLEDTAGKQVSLSQFKGKWVILDFWGSWCIWCIKGFPELKEAYAKYKDILEVVGVDCGETREAWLAGVKKYELPWVNVYNPEGSGLTEKYGVQGFPTKAIIDPEGKIRNITTGHDPEFFVKLSELIGK